MTARGGKQLSRALRVGAALVVVGLTSGVGAAAAANVSPTTALSPVITLDHARVQPGTDVTITLSGFQAKIVTVSVCGNSAERGSVDCNLDESQTVELEAATSVASTRFRIAEPPTPCPCIVRVSSDRFDEVAVAPIGIIGHAGHSVAVPLSASVQLAEPITATATNSKVAAILRVLLVLLALDLAVLGVRLTRRVTRRRRRARQSLATI